MNMVLRVTTPTIFGVKQYAMLMVFNDHYERQKLSNYLMWRVIVVLSLNDRNPTIDYLGKKSIELAANWHEKKRNSLLLEFLLHR